MPRQMRALGFIIALLSFAAPCAGEPAQIGETTYVREGPGRQYAPVDEALTGSSVDISACADGWCRIEIGTRSGYVAQNTLSRTATAEPANDAVRCFTNASAGFHGSQDIRFCVRTK